MISVKRGHFYCTYGAEYVKRCVYEIYVLESTRCCN